MATFYNDVFKEKNVITFAANTQAAPRRLTAFIQQLSGALALHGINAIIFGLYATFAPVASDAFELFTVRNDIFLAICLVVIVLTVLFADSTARSYSLYGRSSAARSKMLTNLSWSWLASFVALAAILPLVAA